jgi:hypothetical protein
VSSEPQRTSTFRVVRTLAILIGLTWWSITRIEGSVFSPVGNPILYTMAVSWLVTMAAIPIGALFATRHALFSLARWEQDGTVYDRVGVRAFRWGLLHSPFGWINPNFHLRPSRGECERLLQETCSSEAVHWVTMGGAVALGIVYIVEGHGAYGYAMLLLRVPWDVYPILLQRWNRARASRILHRQRPAHSAP